MGIVIYTHHIYSMKCASPLEPFIKFLSIYLNMSICPHCVLANTYIFKISCRHINEDKRKTEGQVAMFDIVNDIENCPVSNIWDVFFIFKFEVSF